MKKCSKDFLPIDVDHNMVHCASTLMFVHPSGPYFGALAEHTTDAAMESALTMAGMALMVGFACTDKKSVEGQV